MAEEYRMEELVAITPARPGWYAFFHDVGNEEAPVWGEPIEAWGTSDVFYEMSENEVSGREASAMKVDNETGLLDNSFLNARNFLAVMFYPVLHSIAPYDLVEWDAISQVDHLKNRVLQMLEVRKQMMEEMSVSLDEEPEAEESDELN